MGGREFFEDRREVDTAGCIERLRAFATDLAARDLKLTDYEPIVRDPETLTLLYESIQAQPQSATPNELEGELGRHHFFAKMQTLGKWSANELTAGRAFPSSFEAPFDGCWDMRIPVKLDPEGLINFDGDAGGRLKAEVWTGERVESWGAQDWGNNPVALRKGLICWAEDAAAVLSQRLQVAQRLDLRPKLVEPIR